MVGFVFPLKSNYLCFANAHYFEACSEMFFGCVFKLNIFINSRKIAACFQANDRVCVCVGGQIGQLTTFPKTC